MGQGWSGGSQAVPAAADANESTAQRRKRKHESDEDPEEVSQWDTPRK